MAVKSTCKVRANVVVSIRGTAFVLGDSALTEQISHSASYSVDRVELRKFFANIPKNKHLATRFSTNFTLGNRYLGRIVYRMAKYNFVCSVYKIAGGYSVGCMRFPTVEVRKIRKWALTAPIDTRKGKRA